jgi:hypothetical protein
MFARRFTIPWLHRIHHPAEGLRNLGFREIIKPWMVSSALLTQTRGNHVERVAIPK